jgi:hypothetical protein
MATHSASSLAPAPLRDASRGGARRKLTLALGALCVLGVSAGYFAWRSGQPQRYVVPADPPPVVVGNQTFRQREQAEVYAAAMVAGQERQLAVLRGALQQTERQKPIDRGAATRLRDLIQRRETELANLKGAHQKAPERR